MYITPYLPHDSGGYGRSPDRQQSWSEAAGIRLASATAPLALPLVQRALRRIRMWGSALG